MSLHGAIHLGDGTTRFRVWSPQRRSVTLVLGDGRQLPLAPDGDGYHTIVVEDAGPGARYRYLLDGDGPFADPASRSQPEGVHGPSEVVDLSAGSGGVGAACRAGAGTAGRARSRTGAPPGAPPRGVGPGGTGSEPRWRGMPLAAQVICELHVGTFSSAGTFAGVVEALDHLVEAGYTALECMPLGEFPGTRNWGYDGVFPFAIQSSYGGPASLAALVDAAHRRGVAVLVDVVYNHLGPEGAVHDEYGPYFTGRYATPWGRALNFDGPGSDAVRAYFIEHACYLVGVLGVDGLRLDAVHEIVDPTASPFLAELTSAVEAVGRAAGRTVTVTAESPANDPRLTTPVAAGGLGCGASWDDDFHHALRSTLTGERDRWFADYHGLADLATATTRGWVLTGRESVGFGRHHGVPMPERFSGDRLVVFAQNHDQVGNAGSGRRLAASLPLDAQYPIAAAVLLSPFVPLRFMGEEYGETAPFFFFTSHSDEQLAEAVRQGRAAEVGEHDTTSASDPQDPAIFQASRPDRRAAKSGVHRDLLEWQRELLALRREQPALGSLDPSRAAASADASTGTLAVVRRADPYLDAPEVATICRFAPPPEPGAAPPATGGGTGDDSVAGEDAGGGRAPADPEPSEVALPVLGGRSWRVRAARGARGVAPGDLLDWRDPAEALLALGSYAAIVLVDDTAGGAGGAGATRARGRRGRRGPPEGRP